MTYYIVWSGEVWHGIWYSLVSMAWYMVWPGEVWHGIWYGLPGMAWNMVCSGERWHDILYGLADMVWNMIKPGEVWYGKWKCLCEFHVLWHYLGLWSRSHVEKPMSVGGPVHTYMTRSQVEKALNACSVHMYSSCSLWAVIVNWENVNIYISLTLNSHSYCVLSVDQAFCESLYLFFSKHWTIGYQHFILADAFSGRVLWSRCLFEFFYMLSFLSFQIEEHLR